MESKKNRQSGASAFEAHTRACDDFLFAYDDIQKSQFFLLLLFIYPKTLLFFLHHKNISRTIYSNLFFYFISFRKSGQIADVCKKTELQQQHSFWECQPDLRLINTKLFCLLRF